MSSLSNITIDLLNKKNESAFDILFRLYYPRLVYFAKEYVPYEVARGIAQEVFVVFLKKRPVFENEYQLRGYLYTLTKNGCLMHLRHKKVKENYAMSITSQSIQNEVYESALEQLDTSEITFKEMESIIKKTLESLPPRCREVFILSRYEGKKNREIADCLSISVKAVEAQMTNALKIFRVALKDFLPFLTFLFIDF